MANCFFFVGRDGCEVTDPAVLQGRHVYDYFPEAADIYGMTDAELRAAYQGADFDGIGVAWE